MLHLVIATQWVKKLFEECILNEKGGLENIIVTLIV